MSNLEQRPAESAVTAGTAAVPQPRSERRVLAPREVPLGGPRAMVVRRTLPHRELRTVGAWCFLDDYGPQDVTGTAGMQVPPHPHTGLQTVTWLLDGEVRHQDSLGSDALVRPGELNLMTAGRGISHAETSPAGATGALRGLQLWVALPSSDRDTAPDFVHHDDLPTVTVDGTTVTVLLGSVAGERSPARSFTPIVGAELRLDAGARTELPVEADFEHAVLAVDDVVVAGEPLPAGSLTYLPRGQGTVRLAAGDRGGRALLVGGEPFGEDLLMWWNFVARTKEEMVQARQDWETASDRFGAVESELGRIGAPPPLWDRPGMQPVQN